MNSNPDIFDYTEENKPQKPPMSAKTKKKLVYLLCVVIGILIALGGIYAFDLMFTGAPSPEKAVAEYIRAHNLYDVDGMIEYSSQYNKNALYEHRETSDRLLKAYLNKSYEGKTPRFSENEINVAFVSKTEYTPDTNTFKEQMKEYDKRDEGGSADIKMTAVIKMQVTTGDLVATQEYLAVKIGTRWYYAGNASSF